MANAIVSFSRSRWSSVSPAIRKNLGAKVQRSTILCIEDLGSKILIGIEMCEIVNPFRALTTNCWATLDRTPFYLSKNSRFVHTNPPLLGIS